LPSAKLHAYQWARPMRPEGQPAGGEGVCCSLRHPYQDYRSNRSEKKAWQCRVSLVHKPAHLTRCMPVIDSEGVCPDAGCLLLTAAHRGWGCSKFAVAYGSVRMSYDSDPWLIASWQSVLLVCWRGLADWGYRGKAYSLACAVSQPGWVRQNPPGYEEWLVCRHPRTGVRGCSS